MEPPGLKLAYSHKFSSLLSALVKFYCKLFPLIKLCLKATILSRVEVLIVPDIEVFPLETKGVLQAPPMFNNQVFTCTDIGNKGLTLNAQVIELFPASALLVYYKILREARYHVC